MLVVTKMVTTTIVMELVVKQVRYIHQHRCLVDDAITIRNEVTNRTGRSIASGAYTANVSPGSPSDSMSVGTTSIIKSSLLSSADVPKQGQNRRKQSLLVPLNKELAYLYEVASIHSGTNVLLDNISMTYNPAQLHNLDNSIAEESSDLSVQKRAPGGQKTTEKKPKKKGTKSKGKKRKKRKT